MQNQSTIAVLFELGLALEQKAESFYRRLAQMFPHEAEISRFWKQYADEEAGHARFLQNLRAGLSEAELNRPADSSLVESARQELTRISNAPPGEVRTLEEAYNLAVELENHETNAIFEFLAVNCSSKEHTGQFLRQQLHQHINKLTVSFPDRYKSRLKQREVIARNNE